MTEAVAIEIARKAFQLVEVFETERHRPPRVLLSVKGRGISPQLKDFANLVVYHEHLKDWGTGSFLSKSVVDKFDIPLSCTVDIRSLPGAITRHLGGYGSWLWQAFPGVYAAVFDHSHLTKRGEQIGVPGEQLRQKLNDTKARLYLHELGHFVLHRKELFGDRPKAAKAGFAISAQAEMEAEAWLFANVVMGLALGNRAFLAKVNTYLDDTWEDCCFL
jgi:hypothetical protein